MYVHNKTLTIKYIFTFSPELPQLLTLIGQTPVIGDQAENRSILDISRSIGASLLDTQYLFITQYHTHEGLKTTSQRWHVHKRPHQTHWYCFLFLILIHTVSKGAYGFYFKAVLWNSGKKNKQS